MNRNRIFMFFLLLVVLFLVIKIISIYYPGDSRDPYAVSREFAYYLLKGDKEKLFSLSSSSLNEKLKKITPLASPSNPESMQEILTIRSEKDFKTAYRFIQDDKILEIGVFMHQTPRGWKVYNYHLVEKKKAKK